MAAYDPRPRGARCDECPLYAQGAKPVPPQWARASTVAVPLVLVADSPGFNEVKRGEQMVGATGVKLDELLYAEGVQRRDVMLITSALLCRPEVPDAVGRKRYDLKNWLAWWRKENAARRRAAKQFAEQYPGTPLAESVKEMPNPFECCKPRLDRELAEAEMLVARNSGSSITVGNVPKRLVVMPMGSFALALLLGKPGKMLSITKYRGSVLEPGQGEKP